MKREQIVIAGCTPLCGGTRDYLEEAYAVLTILGCAIAEDSGSKPTDGVVRYAVDAAATLVAHAYAETEK